MLELKNVGIKNVCLMGLMGSGKTIIGKELSNILKIKFYDTDKEIEKDTGENIVNIFNNYGEKYFRKIEKKICLKLLNFENCIISLGGGSVINSEIRKSISENSFSIYLKVKNDVLKKRLLNSKKRPLLLNKNKNDIIEKLYDERKDYYNNANLIVENNSEKKDIILNIISKLSKI